MTLKLGAEAGKPDYVEQPKERDAIQKPLSRMHENTTPRLKLINGEVSIDHPDLMTGNLLVMEALGTGDVDFMYGILWQLARVAGSESKLNFLFSIVKDSKPRDHIEALLATQMAVGHHLAMRSAKDLASAETLQQQESAERIFTKLSRNSLMQAEALKRQRSSGEQSPRIQQNVSVLEGGQAIVGNVTQNPPVTAGKIATAPLALIDARTAPMPILEKRPPQLVRSRLK